MNEGAPGLEEQVIEIPTFHLCVVEVIKMLREGCVDHILDKLNNGEAGYWVLGVLVFKTPKMLYTAVKPPIALHDLIPILNLVVVVISA